MNPTVLAEAISKKDFELDQFVRLVVRDSGIRDEVIHQMLTNPHIMVYYHCFEVISKASQQEPDLFYAYWQDIVSLLDHQNSYHRDFALTILANLTEVDREDRFLMVFEAYCEHFNDEKFMTAQCFVKNCGKILKHKPERRETIAALLMDVENRCNYPVKQKELLKADILDVLDEVYFDLPVRKKAEQFFRQAGDSLSPKTRKKARVLIRKYSLKHFLPAGDKTLGTQHCADAVKTG